MRILKAILVGTPLLLVASCSDSTTGVGALASRTTVPPTVVSRTVVKPVNPPAGPAAIVEQCKSCHGPRLLGLTSGGITAPSIADVWGSYTAATFDNLLATGIMARGSTAALMQASVVPGLTPADRLNIYSYLKTYLPN